MLCAFHKMVRQECSTGKIYQFFSFSQAEFSFMGILVFSARGVRPKEFGTGRQQANNDFAASAKGIWKHIIFLLF